jgi:hypothetical protein
VEIDRLRALNDTDIMDLPELNFFETLQLQCEEDLFLEIMINNMRNGALSVQSTLYKNRMLKIESLHKRLKELKLNFDANAEEIFISEHELTAILDDELKKDLDKYKVSEILNAEKITPKFMLLTKKSKPDNTLEEIKDKRGNHFIDSDARGESITKFYRKVYKKQGEGNDKSINEFLGPVAEHPVVRNAKLTENEKNILDQEITVEELDKALKTCNIKSAPGLDGISNYFIKQFWKYLRIPLLKYACCCHIKGKLTDTFRRAKIRLIPKKGDTSKISNWRPISLLNCLYKLLSRVFAEKLSKVMDKLTPVAQTGYSKTRRCQEALITIVDCINEIN